MAQLAIKGHPTRGGEVIQLLEMLGGENKYNLWGNAGYYVIECGEILGGEYIFGDEQYTYFTLEEFEKIYPYKVGDKVVIENYKQIFEILSVRWCTERNIIMHQISNGWYSVNDLQPYKEETMEERKYADLRLDVDQDDKLATEVTIDGNKITPPKNYLIGKITKVDNGMLIEFVKKQPQYPKDYVNCCECLGHNPFINNVSGYKRDVIEPLQALITCRDTYWKIAGAEMGLNKPWEYDTTKDEFVYAIVYQCKRIHKCEVRYKNHILVFPTLEMRNDFYENFKELIEQCKELL